MKGGWVRVLITKILALIASLTVSGMACAVSMGGIQVTSALGEPLKAEVAIETASKNEANNLSVRLAPPEMFATVGIPYPYGLPRLKFEIETRPGSDQPYLKITSTQPVNEPFVSMLVELSWPSGRLLREYTFLLDPPGYAMEQPNISEVRPVEPSLVDAEMTEPAVQEPAIAADQEGEPVMVDAEAVPEKQAAAEVPEPVAKAIESKNIVYGAIKVKRGDTLYELAQKNKPSDVSLERMLVALYRVNAGKFDGRNMNRIRAGKILRLPDQSELDEVDQAQAVAEIRVQTADWHAYRQKLATASKTVVEQAAEQETSGKISTTVADKAPAAPRPGTDIVKLSKGEAPDDKTVESGGVKGDQDRADALEEEIIAKNKALMESNERIAMLEKNIKAMQRLVELKSQSEAAPETKAETPKLGTLAKVPASAVADAAAANAAQPVSAVQPASAVQPVKRVVKPAATDSLFAILDDLLEEPLYLAGGAAALLALGGLGLALRRRSKRGPKQADTDKSSKSGGFAAALQALRRLGNALKQRSKRSPKQADSDEVGNSGRIAAPTASSPETGDFTSTVVAASSAASAAADDVDPISEADLFLNFGRDEQAEEILKDALTKNPGNHKIHLKLLSIYLNRRDVSAFGKIARQLKDSGDASAWEQAAAMGLKLEPNNPMYGGSGQAAVAEVVEVAEPAAPKAAGEVMFDVSTGKEQKPAMDFDLGFTIPPAEKEDAARGHDHTVAMKAPVDLDVTGSNPNASAAGGAEEPALDLANLIFDVTGSRPAAAPVKEELEATQVIAPEAKPAAKSEAESEPEDQGLAFTLEMPKFEKQEPSPEQAAPKAEVSFDLSSISLDLDVPAAAAPPKPETAPPVTMESVTMDSTQDAHQEVATKLDLAKAYQEMGDIDGARDILQEVLNEGDAQQRADAEALLQQLA